jgi:hypothetical protein
MGLIRFLTSPTYPTWSLLGHVNLTGVIANVTKA